MIRAYPGKGWVDYYVNDQERKKLLKLAPALIAMHRQKLDQNGERMDRALVNRFAKESPDKVAAAIRTWRKKSSEPRQKGGPEPG